MKAIHLTAGALLVLATACENEHPSGSGQLTAPATPNASAGMQQPPAATGGAGMSAGQAGMEMTAGTGGANEPPPSSAYALDENWLCNPNAADKQCAGRADATEIAADNSLSPVDSPATASGLHCFYVYPTVDLTQTAGQVENYDNIEDIQEMARQQAEPFGDVCEIYAPLYHQVTIGTFLDASRDELLENAYAEVEDAFEHYMAQWNDGHALVLIGHSQGSFLLRRLLQRKFDGAANEALRGQLALALLIGALGDVATPPGQIVGGTFESLPLCQAAGERGCIVSYSSYPATMPPGPGFGLYVGGVAAGLEAACVNPAALAGGKAPSAGVFFPSTAKSVQATTLTDLASELGVGTYFAVMRGYYGLECLKNEEGHGYLAASVDADAADQRTDPILYDAPALYVSVVGLHVYDFNLALDDLLTLVRAVQ